MRVAPHQITHSYRMASPNHLRPSNSETSGAGWEQWPHTETCAADSFLYRQMQLIPGVGAHAVRFIFAGVTSLESSCLDLTPSYLRPANLPMLSPLDPLCFFCLPLVIRWVSLGMQHQLFSGLWLHLLKSFIWTLIHDLCFCTSVIWIVVSSSQSLLSQALRKACALSGNEMLTSLIINENNGGEHRKQNPSYSDVSADSENYLF